MESKAISIPKSTIPERIIGALLLAGATVAFFGVGVNKLPSDDMLQEVTQGAMWPENFVTNLVFPLGPHSGIGMQYWNYVFWPSGVLFYAIIWFIIISMLYNSRRTVYGR